MILVTGSSGKTGKAIVSALVRRASSVRAIVRHPSQIEILKDLGAQEAVVGDFLQQPDLFQAMKNIRAVYHICPNVNPDEVVIGLNVIDAARKAGVEYFVLHSVLHPQVKKMPHHWNKLRVEEALFESGLNFTILQPTVYMQNLLARWSLISNTGILLNPYPVETRLTMVDLEDVAEVAAKILTEKGHAGATYELVGTLPLSQTETAAILSEVLNRPVDAMSEPLNVWEENARLRGLGDYQRAALVKMFKYYEQYGLIGNPNILRFLLNCDPTSLAGFVRRIVLEKSRSSNTPAYI